MRQVVLDTETTGLSHESGHRIIEIGCIELVDRNFTGNSFHTYINPQRKVDEGAFRVHGISDSFLSDKPLFKEVFYSFLEFIKDAELIIHNAVFDVNFLNAELKLLKWPRLIEEYCSVCDTLVLAREKHPGQRNTLDALCKRYEVDNSKRDLHGALLDAKLLAHVYLALTGGQIVLFNDEVERQENFNQAAETSLNLASHSPVIFPSALEKERHEDFIKFLVNQSGINLWEEEILSYSGKIPVST